MGVLQFVIDNHSPGAPLKICGDINAQLPRIKKLQCNWYRKPGFNVHSNILYDFLVCNDLLVAYFLHPQNHQNQTLSQQSILYMVKVN